MISFSIDIYKKKILLTSIQEYFLKILILEINSSKNQIL